MNYRHIYMCIVSNAHNQQKLGLRPRNYWDRRNFEKYFEFHHVLPKSLFPNWSKKESNIVALTAREHFFCHQLLTKIYPCKEMAYAAYAMACDKRWKCNSRTYERVKENFSKYNEGGRKQKGIKNPNKGHPPNAGAKISNIHEIKRQY